MLAQIIILSPIPIFLGIVYLQPFDLPMEEESKIIPEEPDVRILYYVLIGVWALYLTKTLLQVKKVTFNVNSETLA
jgi:hypothetical protein